MLPMRKLFWILVIGAILRIIIAILGWTTTIFESYDNSITVVYQRSAYLVAFGYGYEQTLPDSPSYYALEESISKINNREPYTTELPEEGRYYTSHYPPGYPLIGALLFKITGFPICYLLQILGILCDMLTMYLLFKLTAMYVDNRVALLSVLIYSISPQAISLSVSMTPDSLMPLLVVSICYIFSGYYKKPSFKYIIWLGIINGLGGYFRSDFVLLPFAFTLIYLFKFKSINWPQLIRYNVSVAFISLVILTPWAQSNKNQYNEFNPTSTSLGATLVTGVSILPNQWGLGTTDFDRFEEAQAQGFDSPFEFEANNYFKKKFTEYVKENPFYYLKTCLYRTVYFIFAPHSWGIEHNKYEKSFSQVKNEGTIKQSFFYLLSTYWSQLISSLVSFLSFIFFIRYLKQTSDTPLNFIILSVIICVWGSHVFIHMTSVYIMSLYPLQCFLISHTLINYKTKQ